MRDRRMLIPIISAVILGCICAWRIAANRPQDYSAQVAAAVMIRPAPGFEARDSENHLVRLGAFLGRHKVIVLFFDGEAGRDKDPRTAGADQDHELMRLRERFPELQAQGVKAIAVSGTLPQANRAAMKRVGPFPFPLVSDIDPLTPDEVFRIHRQYGRINPQSGAPTTGVFLIDRKGQIQFTVDGPRPIESVDAAIEAALK